MEEHSGILQNDDVADCEVALSESRGSTSSLSHHGRSVRHCVFAVLAVAGCALVVANLADLTASLKGKTAKRQLREKFEDFKSDKLPDELVYGSRRLQTRCAFDLRWVGTKWPQSENFLYPEQREALTELGWTGTKWDNAYGKMSMSVTTTTTTSTQTTLFGGTTTLPPFVYHVPPSEYKCWHELTDIEQDAAKFLQYTVQDWMDCKKMGCPWPTGVPTASATCLTRMKYLEKVYDITRPWMNMTKRKRDNLMLLGWDSDGLYWAAGRWPETYGKPWSELTPRQREAAMYLGYKCDTWSGCTQVTDVPCRAMDSPCLDRLEHIETKMRSWVWETMPAGYRERLVDLGWGPKTWFDGDEPAVLNAQWDGSNAITSKQKMAARILGYTKDTWTKCDGNSQCVKRYEYMQRKWLVNGFRKTWMAMKLAERRAWMLLGHSETLWNTGSEAPTMQMRWTEITPEQQKEAMFLGYTEGVWQGCNLLWGENQTATQQTDPNGYVRARMKINKPYSEISGNVHGNPVKSMPVSFIRVFEDAVARALFCGNPPLSLTPASYLAPDGEPLCVEKTKYEMERKRVRVLNVVEGSIVVDFYLVANVTATQDTARLLYENLKQQLEDDLTSPICHDKYFGRYAKVATIAEHLVPLYPAEIMKPLLFEAKRNFYGESNYCLLHQDHKEGVTTCGTSSAEGLPRTFCSRGFTGMLLALLMMICMTHP